jgi:hypothetical protein
MTTLEDSLKLARACDQVIRQAANAMERASLRIGYYGLVLKDNNLFRELGFDDEQAYYESCGIGRSTWFRALEIASAFKGVDRDRILSMKIENARMLAKAPDDIRKDQCLIDLASTAPCRDFEIKLKMTLPKIRFGVAKIRRLNFSVEMSDKERREAQQLIEVWMTSHRVSDRGKAMLDMLRCAMEYK